MNRSLIMLLLFITATLGVFAEQLTKVGIVDFQQVVNTFYTESREVRSLQALIKRYEEEKTKRKDEIQKLGEEKLKAKNSDDQIKTLQLEESIRQKEGDLKEFSRVRINQINSMKEKLYKSSQFATELYNAIKYVGQSEGFTVIIKKSDPNLLYFAEEVDITEIVIQTLRRMANR